MRSGVTRNQCRGDEGGASTDGPINGGPSNRFGVGEGDSLRTDSSKATFSHERILAQWPRPVEWETLQSCGGN